MKMEELLTVNDMMVILGRALKKKGLLKNNTVVGTVMTNMAIEKALNKSGIKFIRAHVGDRYVMQETLGIRFGGIFKNRYFASGSSLVFAYILCIGNGYQAIWPIFGASNQLIGTLALFTASAYLFGIKAPKWFTLIPAYIMLAITESALFYQGLWLYLPKHNYLLLIIAIILFILGIFVSVEATRKIFFSKEKLNPVIKKSE